MQVRYYVNLVFMSVISSVSFVSRYIFNDNYFFSAGIGIAGREGKQASLAADFSITQFSHVARLLLVHGRRSYKRSASLSQFVIHRGLIISTMQAIFSAVFYFSSVALYQGFLMVGYVISF